MYLSNKHCFDLDNIIKSFEVAYRSYIVNTLKVKYYDLNLFSITINKIDASLDRSSILFSHKYKTKISKIKKEVGSYYNRIDDSYNTYLTKKFDNDVPYVSEIIDYVILFFNDCFASLSDDFNSVEEFNGLNTKYLFIRNLLSHPASTQITVEDTKQIISFIKKISSNIQDNFFWYIPLKDLHEWMDNLISNIENSTLRYHNLSDVSFSHNKLIEREDELKVLNDLMYGKDVGYRRSGSIAIYGYGGVGKTALVLEFLYRLIKTLNDNTLNEKFDFLIFFSSKEELLTYNETTKKLYIRDIQKQIVSFKDFKGKLFDSLSISTDEEFKVLRGIIIIDNVETLSEHDKEDLLDFIKQTPRTIQFILTSRNEEPCEDKLNLKEFDENKKGIKFIDEYILGYNYSNVKLENHQKLKLIQLSKGNTLIIVLSLQLLNNNYSNYNIENIFNDLESVESKNIEIISDFMYKNTIGQAIDFLQTKKADPTEILKVISVYEVPVDLYSISKISNVNVQLTEYVCDYLTTKLILEKQGETFKPNEFANKFIISKFIPNRIELKRLIEKIKIHKKELEQKLNILEVTRKKQPLLNQMMDDWRPKNSIDKIAISEAFTLYNKTDVLIKNGNVANFHKIESEFDRLEKMSAHPYIKFQKARCLKLVHDTTKDLSIKKNLQVEIAKYFEYAIDTTDFYYPFIKNTKSYASINWLYGFFLSNIIKDYYKSSRYLEDAIILFKKLNIKDKSYYTAIHNLSAAYLKLYQDTKDPIYLQELKPLFNEIVASKQALKEVGFDDNRYLTTFTKHVSVK